MTQFYFMIDLMKKYNVQAPRYTSYPTLPHWEEQAPNQSTWKTAFQQSIQKHGLHDGISIYIHLPYCESLCHYCGCNTAISKDHQVETPYIRTLLKEWRMYRRLFPEKPIIKELHLGGGTPTFFSPENLTTLISGILENCIVPEQREFSFEGHPNNTTKEHLSTLHDLGFNRVSFGVQDTDLAVQKAINRVQPTENVVRVTQQARELGYESVNFDLVYGLPFQTKNSIADTFYHVRQLMPDRIAYYSYAHVPWKKGWQRKFSERDLPQSHEKRALYEQGKQLLSDAGYYAIGMDHFTLQTDSLYDASMNQRMHRNFMGYTTSDSKILVGLGASAISDISSAYMQNEKKVNKYIERVEKGEFPIIKGHYLNSIDKLTKKHILELICNYSTNFNSAERIIYEKNAILLWELQKDRLIEIRNNKMQVTDTGKKYIRNICMALDPRMTANQQGFSLSV